MTTSSLRSARPGSLAVVVAAGMVLLGGFAFLGGASLLANKPAVAAAVDLEKVYDGLEEQKAADAALESMAAAMNADGEKRRKALDDLRAELESFKPGSPAFRETSNKIELELLRYNALVEFNRQKIEARRAEYIRGIYARVKETLATLSKEQGIDIVFLDDSIAPLDPSDAQRTMQQISARRMLYCNPSLDLTELLTTRMNDVFKASGGLAPTTASGSTPSGS